MNKSLVVFDLDGTLIDEDCAQRWLTFLQQQNWPCAASAKQRCDQVMEGYDSGQMDMGAYMEAWLAPLQGVPTHQARELAEQFTEQYILPTVFPSGFIAVDDHKKQNHIVLIISASPTLIVEPIAHLFGVHHVIGIDAVIKNDVYTGQAVEPFSFGRGKLLCLKQWQQRNGIEQMPVKDMYSDSINDLPLLQHAQNGHVINPNEDLLKYAEQNHWASYTWRVKN